MMEVFKQFRFEAAHRLPNVEQGHKCGRLHGHSYKVVFFIRGDVDPHTGFVIDFGDVKKIVKPVIDELDHSCLNDLIHNPTAENLATWISLHVYIPGLHAIEIWETETAGVKLVVSG